MIATPGIAHADITTGLVGWWKLDDGSGTTAADSSGTGNNGTVVNSPQWLSNCARGGCLNLNGKSQYLWTSGYSNTNGTVSGAAWVNFNGTNSSVIKNWGGSVGQFHLDVGTVSNKLAIFIGQSNGASIGPVSDSTNFPFNSWQFVAFVADGTEVHLYRNGVEVGTPVSYNGTLSANLSCIGIGVKLSNSCDGTVSSIPNYANGMIDDVRIYNRALSSADVAQLYADTGGYTHQSSVSGNSTILGNSIIN